MKVLNAKNMAKSRQKGFTIIELIVVILLLGILTATALPRFLDVTDSAHTAVVDAVLGGLATGNALFRAAWVAGGEDTAAATGEFGDGLLFGNSSGYPIGADATFSTSADCLNIYQKLLQSGAPIAASVAQASAGTTANTDVTGAASSNPTADIIAILDDEATDTTCEYYYVGQFRTASSGSAPLITLNVSTGEVLLGTPLAL
jgi:prepilin-type N-terminal cleavage/methylation domain-containing protein